MFNPWKKYITVALISFLFGLIAMYYAVHRDTVTVLPSADSSVPKHDVVTKKPIQALDKKALAKVVGIPSAIVKDDKKEILATGNTSGDSGTSTVSAVLDSTTGMTVIVEKRPFAEWMNKSEIGIGYTIGSLGMGYAAEFRQTFARVWNIYPNVRAEIWQWDSGIRKDEGHRIDAQATAFITWRFQ